jgi:hypothetical protein
VDAELGYVTGGLTWKVNYNAVSTETSDLVDLIGWVTIENRSGKSVPEATIALMAGDVNKTTTRPSFQLSAAADMVVANSNQPVVTEKPFDDYHLYRLGNKTTLLDSETKQVEFVRATGIATKRMTRSGTCPTMEPP